MDRIAANRELADVFNENELVIEDLLPEYAKNENLILPKAVAPLTEIQKRQRARETKVWGEIKIIGEGRHCCTIIDHGYDASLRAHPLHARIDSMPSTTTAAPGASEQKWLNGGGHAVCRSVIEDGICVSGSPPALKTVNMRKLRKNSKVLSSCEAYDDDDDEGHGTMSCAQQCCAMCGTEPLCRSWSFDQQKNCLI